MDAKLVIVGGKANKSQVSVKLPTVIGRSREADLTVAHPMISRKHCELYEVDGLVRIRDLGSLNG
ncbi:MAG: FHA domain-containing protein, partial [Planctomycetota bacterium]